MECLCSPYCFLILSWFTEFVEFIESHWGKTQMGQLVCTVAVPLFQHQRKKFQSRSISSFQWDCPLESYCAICKKPAEPNYEKWKVSPALGKIIGPLGDTAYVTIIKVHRTRTGQQPTSLIPNPVPSNISQFTTKSNCLRIFIISGVLSDSFEAFYFWSFLIHHWNLMV